MFFFSDRHILLTILLTPLAGAALLMFIPRERADLQRKIANIFGLVGLVVSLPLVWEFKSISPETFQFVSDVSWIPSLGVHFRLGLDGLSLLMVLLTTFLGAIAIFSSWHATREPAQQYYILLLLLQAGLLGVFMSLDFILFYVFWEAILVPVYLLIGSHRSPHRIHVATKLFLCTLAGSVVMLLTILAVYQARGTFDIRELLLHPFTAQAGSMHNWLFWGFVLAFAIKMPMFPFHTWLADALAEAPTALCVVLAGVLLKTGTYGLLRFSLPMFPGAALKFRPVLIALSLFAIIYGALISLAQKDIKRLIALSSISQMGLCTLGIFVLTPLGIYGSIILQVSHGLTIAALFLIAGILCHRRQTQLISEFGGLAKSMPKFAAVYLIVTLAALGAPLLSGFPGEFAVLRAASQARWQWAALAMLGVFLVALCFLWLYARVSWGDAANPQNENLPDLNKWEFAALIPVVLLSLLIGLYPTPIFRVLQQPMERIVNSVHPGYFPETQSAVSTSAAEAK